MRTFLTILVAVILGVIAAVIIMKLCKHCLVKFCENHEDQIKEAESESKAQKYFKLYEKWKYCVSEVKKRFKEGDCITYNPIGTIRIVKFYENSSRIDYEYNGNLFSCSIPELIRVEKGGRKVELVYRNTKTKTLMTEYYPEYDWLLHRDSNSGNGKRIHKVVDLFKESYPVGSEFVDPAFPDVRIEIKGYSETPVERKDKDVSFNTGFFARRYFPGRVDFSVNGVDYSTTICNLVYYKGGSFHLYEPYGPAYWVYYEKDEIDNYYEGSLH